MNDETAGDKGISEESCECAECAVLEAEIKKLKGISDGSCECAECAVLEAEIRKLKVERDWFKRAVEQGKWEVEKAEREEREEQEPLWSAIKTSAK